MCYDREYYLRTKRREVRYHCPEEENAYKRIKENFLLDDIEIKKLLREYTVTEILSWEFQDWKFVPKELIKIYR